jgi:hypothetical protein
MGKLLRRLRGLAGVGVTWGAMWAGIGAGIGLIIGIVEPDAWRWTNPVLDWAYGMGLYGFVSGIGFGTLLSLKEGRKRLFDLSLGGSCSGVSWAPQRFQSSSRCSVSWE